MATELYNTEERVHQPNDSRYNSLTVSSMSGGEHGVCINIFIKQIQNNQTTRTNITLTKEQVQYMIREIIGKYRELEVGQLKNKITEIQSQPPVTL